VVVPRAEKHTYLHPLATRAGERVSEPVAGFIERAQQGAYVSVVAARRQTEGIAADSASWLACMAAKLGYFTRVCEFEDDLLVDIPDASEYLTEYLEGAYRERTTGMDWLATVCATAAVMMNAVRTEPYSADVVELLAPTGFGHDAHVGLCSWLINGLRASPHAQQSMTAGAEEITDEDLSDCWMYGYYLRACENALPDEARQELAGT
jgi:hypothetical protein